MKRLLCAVGIHHWKPGTLYYVTVFHCARCGEVRV